MKLLKLFNLETKIVGIENFKELTYTERAHIDY